MSSKAKGTSKFVQESAAAAGAATAAVTKQIMSLTTPADQLPGNLLRRNMPPMIKPGDIPVGAAISGEIVSVVDSPVSTIKGKLLWLRHSSGQEFTFPCTGVIRNALAPGKKEGEELDKVLEKEVGKTLYAKRLPDKTSSKYKKTMYMFDVFTSGK